MILTLTQFQKAAAIDVATATRWLPHIQAACAEFDISNGQRLAAFIAQTGHESQGFKVVCENLFYTDAARVARLFRSKFDVNNNGVIEPFEIEDARAYTRNPQKLANRIYAVKGGNGSEASGDGWKYRGRGLIQITLRDNYARCGHSLGLNLLAEPDLLIQDALAARSAAWYWAANNCNSLADAGDFDATTRRINPAMAGRDDRRARYQVAERTLCR